MQYQSRRLGQAARLFSLLIASLAANSSVNAQTAPVIYSQGLTAPIGIAVDDNGRLWVAQQGNGNDNSQVSVVTPDGQAHPFIQGLPSARNADNEVVGTNHVYFDDDGNLMIVQGEGSDSLSAAVLLVDTTGFVPGAPALDVTSVHTVVKVGEYANSQGYSHTNPYTLGVDATGDWYIVDAAANAVFRRTAATGSFSVLTTFPPVSNNTGIGPSMVHAVPTGISVDNGQLLVGSLTGFPFGNGAASVYEVDSGGSHSVFRGGLTTIVDVDVDPTDGELVVLQHAAFRAPPPFTPFTGAVFKLRSDGGTDTLATGLHRPSAMRFAPNGDLYISTVTNGQVLKLEATPTDVESFALPERSLATRAPYPNPFRTGARIVYRINTASTVAISVSDALGREIRHLRDAQEVAGEHEIVWDGMNDAGIPVAPGVYFVRISTPTATVASTVVKSE